MEDTRIVAVVGAGVMGSDVALDLASNGYHVLLKDIDEVMLEKALSKIKKDFRFLKMMKPSCATLSRQEVLARIQYTTTYEGFDQAQIVIENVIPQNNHEGITSRKGASQGQCMRDTQCTLLNPVGKLTVHFILLTEKLPHVITRTQ